MSALRTPERGDLLLCCSGCCGCCVHVRDLWPSMPHAEHRCSLFLRDDVGESLSVSPTSKARDGESRRLEEECMRRGTSGSPISLHSSSSAISRSAEARRAVLLPPAESRNGEGESVSCCVSRPFRRFGTEVSFAFGRLRRGELGSEVEMGEASLRSELWRRLW